MSDDFVRTAVVMDTVVSIRVVGPEPHLAAVGRAVDWFHRIEACCTRFDAGSEVMRLAERAGAPVPVSDMLFEIVRFAIALAEESEGAFDPTVGHRMEARGFDREYRSGTTIRTAAACDGDVTYRDVELDPASRAITLRRPLVLDLGAVAKGFAVDMAARELREAGNFAIDAGGDLYLGGHNATGEPWAVGIRHPRRDDETIETLHVSNAAVCTSGDYLRRNARGEHHIMDPRTGVPATTAASATVVAPLAMVADGLSTAAFVLGPPRGIELLERHGVTGLIITTDLERVSTRDD